MARHQFALSRIPDSVSDEDFRNIADCRRAAWTGGFKGLAIGMSTGVLAYSVLRRAPTLRTLFGRATPLTPNHAFVLAIGGGCFGSWLGSLTAAQNNKHLVQPVLDHALGREPTAYQVRLQGASEGDAAGGWDDEQDAAFDALGRAADRGLQGPDAPAPSAGATGRSSALRIVY